MPCGRGLGILIGPSSPRSSCCRRGTPSGRRPRPGGNRRPPMERFAGRLLQRGSDNRLSHPKRRLRR
eukprot:11441479-Alexandrium_andersonii.AAC.1